MTGRSLAVRSVAAVLLMIGFYVLALGIAAALAYLPYAEWTYAHRIHPKLAIGCLFGAGAILLAIVPRRDVFEPPGPRLEPARQPELFAKLRTIAARTGQEMPVEVYLVPDMNAFVTSRGGVMGFGSRRVMGIGLALLQVLQVGELEAVLAHEFGHYHGGDTRLGPWIYKTRAAIGRTLASLGRGSWLQLPFRLYGSFFLRVTQAISRAQELTADRLAATLCGRDALVRGLENVHANASAFVAYWRQEALPVLSAGFHAPIGAGFVAFLRAPAVAQAVESALAAEREGRAASPYDSHPPLRERIAAVRDVPRAPVAPRPDAHDPAVGLLRDLAAVENALIGSMAKGGAAARFQAVAWDDVPERVLLPQWEELTRKVAPIVGGRALAALPALAKARAPDLVAAAYGAQAKVPPQHLGEALAGVLGASILTALRGHGFVVTAPLGEPPMLRRADAQLEPFLAASKLFTPEGEAEWTAWLERHELGRVTLAAASQSER